MRIAGIALLIIALAPAVTPAAARAEGSKDECGEYSQAAMRSCLEDAAKKSDQTLKQAQRRVATAISTWDEDDRYTSIAAGRLTSSIAAFEVLRQKQCAFESSLGGGAIANALEIRRLRCVIELNRIQAARLIGHAEGL